MSGQYGFLGESFKKALDMAVGKDPRIKVIYEDDQFDAKRGLSAFQKLTSIDNVDVIINESSPTMEAITPLVDKSRIPVFQIFETREHAKDTIFQLLPFSYGLATDLAKLAEKHYKRIAMVWSGATDVLEIDAQYFKNGMTSSSTIVADEKVTSTDDMRTAITKALAANPDAITNIFVLNDGIRFIKEFKAIKGNKKIDLICDVNTEFAINDYIKALGTSTFEGCLSTNLPDMTSSQFKSEYKSRYGSEAVIGADWGYDAMTIIKGLVGTPKSEWIEKIQNSSFDGASGHVSFDENGTRPAVSERHIFRGGKFVKLEE